MARGSFESKPQAWPVTQVRRLVPRAEPKRRRGGVAAGVPQNFCVPSMFGRRPQHHCMYSAAPCRCWSWPSAEAVMRSILAGLVHPVM